MNLFCRGLKNSRTQTLLLLIQSVFKEKKIIFKEYFKDLAVFHGVFEARANHVEGPGTVSIHMLIYVISLIMYDNYKNYFVY